MQALGGRESGGPARHPAQQEGRAGHARPPHPPPPPQPQPRPSATACPGASAVPSQATQDGLVDLGLRDTTVQVPIAVAANVCGIAVDVLSGLTLTGLTLTGPTTCDALAEATAGA